MNHPAKGYIFDVPRCDTIKGKKNMWKAIEQIKNGLLYDRRYTSRKMWIDPKILCSNELPDRENLSADRWNVCGLTDYGDGVELLHGIMEGIDSQRRISNRRRRGIAKTPKTPKGAPFATL